MRKEIFGGWVELRDPQLVPERLRRPVFEKSAEGAMLVGSGDEVTPETIAFFSEFNDAVAVALIEKWSFGDVITVDSLLDLPSRAYDEIRSIVSPFLTELMPNFDLDPDPKVITEP
jgi:hypothetical protein